MQDPNKSEASHITYSEALFHSLFEHMKQLRGYLRR